MIANGEKMLKISVKGSRDGAWGLTQTQLKRQTVLSGQTDYRIAADNWLKRHAQNTAMCFVQFKGVDDSALPRVYMAWPKDVAKILKSAREGKGVTKLVESQWKRDRSYFGNIPNAWVMTRERVSELLDVI